MQNMRTVRCLLELLVLSFTLSTDVNHSKSACSGSHSLLIKNTVYWMVIEFLNRERFDRDDLSRTVEWGPKAVEAMYNEVRDFRVPCGKDGRILTAGDYIDRNPKGLLPRPCWRKRYLVLGTVVE